MTVRLRYPNGQIHSGRSSSGILPPTDAQTRKSTNSRRTAPRDARPLDPQDPRARTGARTHHRARDRIPVGRGAPGRTRVPLSRAPPARGPRLDCLVLGHFREQPQGALLPSDTGRPPPADRADAPLGHDRCRDLSRAETGVSLKRFFRRGWWDSERARELEAHLAIETDENIARGLSAADARLAALRQLGNRARIREAIYQMNTAGVLDALWRDLRYG